MKKMHMLGEENCGRFKKNIPKRIFFFFFFLSLERYINGGVNKERNRKQSKNGENGED